MNTLEEAPYQEQFPTEAADAVTYGLVLIAGLMACLEAQLVGGPWGAAASLGLVGMIWALRGLLVSVYRPLSRS